MGSNTFSIENRSGESVWVECNEVDVYRCLNNGSSTTFSVNWHSGRGDTFISTKFDNGDVWGMSIGVCANENDTLIIKNDH